MTQLTQTIVLRKKTVNFSSMIFLTTKTEFCVWVNLKLNLKVTEEVSLQNLFKYVEN